MKKQKTKIIILKTLIMKMKTTPRDQMIHIMRTIWSSRNKEQLKSCRNMIKTFEKNNGSQNIGITLLEIEFARQERLNGLFKSMGKVQKALQDQNKKNNNINPKMLMSKDELKKENKN